MSTPIEADVENNRLLSSVVGNIPDVMAELTKSYIANTDYNARAKIKMRMKAFLDMLSVDSTYPNSPGMSAGPQIPDEDFNPMLRGPTQVARMPGLPGGLEDYLEAGPRLPRPYPIGMGPLPAPGAPMANPNADFLR